MRTFEFYQLDVFTDTAFGGNPLAVFPDGADLTAEEMQKIAREMNLSETVFVLPSEKAVRRLRIFTPTRELPLAGHPVVGAWNLLARLGVVKARKNGVVRVEQELKLGVLPVEIEFKNEMPERVVMTQGAFAAGETVSDEDEISRLAAALGLERSDLAGDGKLPFQSISTGIKALAVPVASLKALERCRINSSLLAEIYLKCEAIGCYVFALETIEAASRVHARFFAPDDGISEDPATGSAAGSLSGYLVHHGAIETEDGFAAFTIEQGDFMNRPSRIFVEVSGAKGRVEQVRVGGSSVVVAKGEIFFD